MGTSAPSGLYLSDADIAALPDDPAILKQKLRETCAIIRSTQDQFDQILHAYTQLRRRVFGKKSEKLPAEGQMLFAFVGTVEFDARTDEPIAEEERRRNACAKAPRPTRPRRGRTSIPDDLPRVQVVHDVPENERRCSGCKKEMKQIGVDKSRRIEYEPAKIVVIEDLYPKFGCGTCRDKIVTSDEPVDKPILRGLPGPGLLAQILVAKYADGLPLFRQQVIFRRLGVELPRSTMCGWIEAGVDLLRPVAVAIRKNILQSHVVCSDSTPFDYLVPGQKNGQARRGYAWGYLGDAEHPYVVYEFTTDHCQERPMEFLNGFQGQFLECDGHASYNGVFKTGKIIHVGCWTHSRRYVFESRETDPARSAWLLEKIRILYRVERQAKNEGLDYPQWTKLRQEQSRPVLNEIKTWLDEQGLVVLPKSPIGEAIGYILGQWPALGIYTTDARLPIDNNELEQEIRPIAVGRKAYLFFGSEAGGEWASVAYTLVRSAARNGINPYAYLKDLLTRLPTLSIKRIDELLPLDWKKLYGKPEQKALLPPPPGSS
jgi:transposase